MDIDYTGIKVSQLTNQQIEAEADKLRLKFWGDKIPVDIDLIIERDLKLQLTPIPDFKKNTGSEAILTGSLDEIAFEPNQYEVRIRFSLAHEVGHLILHPEVIEKLRTFTNFEEWKEIILNLPGGMWGLVEKQANIFAAFLLIPTSVLKKEIKNLKSAILEAEKIIGKDNEAIYEYIAPILAKLFSVADITMLIRLKNSNIDLFEVINEE